MAPRRRGEYSFHLSFPISQLSFPISPPLKPMTNGKWKIESRCKEALHLLVRVRGGKCPDEWIEPFTAFQVLRRQFPGISPISKKS